MGKIVSVWSPTKKVGKTVFLYIFTSYLSSIIDKDLKLLVGCVNLRHDDLMGLFDIDKGELNFEDIVNYRIHPGSEFEMLNALAKMDNMYFIGSKKTSSVYVSRHMKNYENLLEEFKQTFDLVLLDTISGSENPLTNMVINKSNYVLNILNQDIQSLNRQRFVTGKDAMYIINNYRDIYPSRREMESIYGLKNVYTLPYCSELQEMKNRGRLEFYCEHDTDYMKGVKRLSDVLIDMLNITTIKEFSGEKKKRKLGDLLGGLI